MLIRIFLKNNLSFKIGIRVLTNLLSRESKEDLRSLLNSFYKVGKVLKNNSSSYNSIVL